MSECPTPTGQTPTAPMSRMSRVRQALLEMVTGRDNRTHDIGRWSWLVCTASVLGLAGWHEHQGVHVPVRDLAISLAAVATAHGIGIGMKAGAEPGGNQ